MWVTENEESRSGDVSLREDHGGSVQDPESHVRDWRERFKSSLDKALWKCATVNSKNKALHFANSHFQQLVRVDSFSTLHNEF